MLSLLDKQDSKSKNKNHICIAILGCGTVGSGLVKLLKYYPEIEVSKILVRDLSKERDFDIDASCFTDNVEDILRDTKVQIIVEVMGGISKTKDILLKALKQGKHIVTANKDLLALEGKELFETAKANNKVIQYEAAVAGGIPIITTLKQSLQGNRIEHLYGIINGTTNYMLDAMEREGLDFASVLAKAQTLGFAEADPSNDVGGKDAAYKIAILASIISGKRIDCSQIFTEGIEKISLTDIRSASKRGYRIKLLGIVDNTGPLLDLRVHPTLVKLDNPLANVHREYNAIMIRGDAVQDLTLIGKGAGSLPTASSVLGDILMLASQINSSSEPHPQYVCQHSEYAQIKNIDSVLNSFYVRISMHDKVGVLKDLGAITANNNANIKFIDQYEAHDGVALGDFMIDPISEKSMQIIIREIQALDSIRAVESVIRVLV